MRKKLLGKPMSMCAYGLVGVGHMGKAIGKILLAENRKTGEGVMFADSDVARLPQLAAGGANYYATTDVARVAKMAKVIFLAVRPADVDAVAAQMKPHLRKSQLIVSIVAGKTLAKLRKAFGPKVRLIRVMPNLGMQVGMGAGAYSPDKSAGRVDVELIDRLLNSERNKFIRLPEKDLDVVTALSGSGPAFFAYVMIAAARAGVKLGLTPKASALLTEKTIFGTLAYLTETKTATDEFIKAVCTPGGTTEAGMKELSSGPFDKALLDTLKAAADRARELGK